MARRLIIAWLVATSAYAYAASSPNESERYQLKGAWIDFLNEPSGKLRISKSCLSGGKLSCQAYSAFKGAPTIKVNPGSGGKNPGAIKCEALDGSVVIGESARGDEISFCEFSDHSYVDCGSL